VPEDVDDSDYTDEGSPFFFSYAHAAERSPGGGAAHDPDQYVEQFFQDLSENVGQLISLRVGVDAGFMDREMRGGMQWPDELLHALGTCQVLVALLSVRYLKSEWCGKEWHAFSQRTVRRLESRKANPRQGCIIPVIWAPLPAALPTQISKELIFSPTRRPNPDVPGQYQENGIFGLLRMRGLKDAYDVVTWQLAMHISRVYYSQRVEFREFKDEELRSIFRSAGRDRERQVE
jgi:hypothetical protein